MGDLIKQGAAYSRTVLMTDSADHITGKAGLTLAVSLAKAGGAFASVSPTVTDRGNGRYTLALAASHTDTLGALDLLVTATGADPTDTHDQVVAFDPNDAAALGLTRISGDAFARLGAPAGASIAADIAANQASLTTVAGYTDTLEAAVAAVQTAVNTVSGFVDTEVGAIKTVTDKINTMLDQSGSNYRLTVAALANVPAGSDTVLEVVTATGAGGPEVTATGSGG